MFNFCTNVGSLLLINHKIIVDLVPTPQKQ